MVLDKNKDEISIKISSNYFIGSLHYLVPRPPNKLTYLCLLVLSREKWLSQKQNYL